MMNYLTDDQLQEYYDKYRNYQADVVTLSLTLHDLINLIRTVDISLPEPPNE